MSVCQPPPTEARAPSDSRLHTAEVAAQCSACQLSVEFSFPEAAKKATWIEFRLIKVRRRKKRKTQSGSLYALKGPEHGAGGSLFSSSVLQKNLRPESVAGKITRLHRERGKHIGTSSVLLTGEPGAGCDTRDWVTSGGNEGVGREEEKGSGSGGEKRGQDI